MYVVVTGMLVFVGVRFHERARHPLFTDIVQG